MCFPVNFCEIFKNIVFTEHLQTTAYGQTLNTFNPLMTNVSIIKKPVSI